MVGHVAHDGHNHNYCLRLCQSYHKPFYCHFIAEQVLAYTIDHKLIPIDESASDLFYLLQESQASYHSFIVENKEYEFQLPVLKKSFQEDFHSPENLSGCGHDN